jgi:protein-tyrosine phosphatase
VTGEPARDAGAAVGRDLDWEGCFNVRDLGGLRTRSGRPIRRGAVVRADTVEGLTGAGWDAAWRHGVRTVIDLRNDDERGIDAAPRPEGIETVHLPLDAIDDDEFWRDWRDGPQYATPMYYPAHLERFPERSSAVLSAVTRAVPGGVVVHCHGGRDRTGQIVMLLLALAGVAPTAIAADYARSTERLSARYAAAGEPDQGVELAAFLEARGTTAADLVVEAISGFDVEQRLGPAGLTAGDVAALRARLAVA